MNFGILLLSAIMSPFSFLHVLFFIFSLFYLIWLKAYLLLYLSKEYLFKDFLKNSFIYSFIFYFIDFCLNVIFSNIFDFCSCNSSALRLTLFIWYSSDFIMVACRTINFPIMWFCLLHVWYVMLYVHSIIKSFWIPSMCLA